MSRFDDIKKTNPLRELFLRDHPHPWYNASFRSNLGSLSMHLSQKSISTLLDTILVLKDWTSYVHYTRNHQSGHHDWHAVCGTRWIIFSITVEEINKVLEIFWVPLLLTYYATTEVTPYFVDDLLFLLISRDLSMILSKAPGRVYPPIDHIPLINLSQSKKLPVRILLLASLGDFLWDKSLSKKLHIYAGRANTILTRYTYHTREMDSWSMFARQTTESESYEKIFSLINIYMPHTVD